MFAKMKIGIRLSLALAGSALLSVAATTASNIWFSARMMEATSEHQLATLDDMFVAKIQDDAQRAVTVASSIAVNGAVVQAFAARDRAALAEMLVSGYETLKSKYGIDQMQFHTPDAKSFLRVNNPAKFGDDLSAFRFTVVNANKTQTPVFGLENGVTGIGIRGVVPVSGAKGHLGTVEIGLTFGKPFLADFTRMTGADVAVYLKTDKGFDLLGSTFPEMPTISQAELQSAMSTRSPLMDMKVAGVDHAVSLGPVKDYGGQVIGVRALALDRSALMAAQGAARRWSIAIGVGMLAFTLMLSWLMHRNIARPIHRIGEVLMALAHGDKSVDIPYTERGDEIGDNARAAQAFRDNISRVDALEAERREAEIRSVQERQEAEAHALAERHAAREREEAAGKQAMHKIVNDFEGAVGGIIDLVSASATELEATAGVLNGTADATRQRTDIVASASEEASVNVQAVASATEQLTASVGEISKQVHTSSEIARHAVEQAQKTDQRVAELSKAANRIGDVVKLITAIAEQTNLLALNATIEAARAGDAGRGFAVVAQEVKALASQTAKATDEIAVQISGMQTATAESVSAIKEIGETIGRISEISAAIATAVEEQNAATREIARNVEEAAKGTTQVTTNIVDVNRHAAETGAASTEMLSAAQSLSQESNHLKIEMDNFLATVRTGIGNRRKTVDPNYRGPDRRQHREPAADAGTNAA
jgi:methyl-accepting chemotaxis protein